MNKAVRKFAVTAEFAVFILLAVLLSVINVVNFAMASDDADMITQRIAEGNGILGRDKKPDNKIKNNGFDDLFRPNGTGGFRNMGPNSPEMNFSIRYFTYAFDKDGNAHKIIMNMSAVDEVQAEKWAKSLLGSSTGWSNVNYRYRVFEKDGLTYVTVIDQGRELLPS